MRHKEEGALEVERINKEEVTVVEVPVIVTFEIKNMKKARMTWPIGWWPIDSGIPIAFGNCNGRN